MGQQSLQLVVHNQPSARVRLTSGVALALGVLVAGPGCEQDEGPARRRAPAEAIPESVVVSGGRVVEGTPTGRLRRERTVGRFRITKAPVTVSRWSQCQAAGVCSAPAERTGMCANTGPSHAPLDGQTADRRMRDGARSDNPDDPPDVAEADPSDLPVTCVTPEQAASYCDWVGGRLAGTAEWALAARGVEPVRFAWGNDPASCDHHWRPAFVESASPCCDGECTVAVASVGQRGSGESPSGMTDVLSGRAELLAPDTDSAWAACRRSTCVATGLAPGAIDGYRPTWAHANAPLPITFRCAWEERSP